MLRSDNLIEDITIDDKIRVNDEKYSNTALGLCEDLFNGDVPRRQLIRYRVNSDNQITAVETAMPENSKKSSLRCIQKGNSKYRTLSRSFEYKSFIGSDTDIFVVPKDTTSMEIGAKRNFKIADISYFKDNYSYNVQSYTLGDDLTEACAVVVTKDSAQTTQTIPDWQPIHVIKKISEQVDDYDEIITVMEVQRGDTVTEYVVEQDAIDNIWFGSNTQAYELGVGDAVRICTNSEGNVDLIELIYDADKKEYKKPRSGNINDTFTCPYSFSYGISVKRAKDSAERIYIDYNLGENTPKIVIMPLERFETTIVDMSERKVDIFGGKATENIKTSDIFGKEQASKVIFTTNLGAPMASIIYNY